MNEQMRQVVEIPGVKLDLDMRTAVRVETLRVGDRVKVLEKQYSDWKASPGVIVGFEPFKSLPTIIVAVARVSYASVDLAFVYINAQTENVEIVKSIDDDQCDLQKDKVEAYFVDAIAKKRTEIEELERRREFFLREFRAYWTPVQADAEVQS